MAKKLIKYGKFLMSVALIFCLMVPSYASLSASDGSAFVTKTEFDSALADFNARLTTFEAGINSKIDSQVTSYLDRNGIWSGMAQTILWPNKKQTFTLGEMTNTNDYSMSPVGSYSSKTNAGSYTDCLNALMAGWPQGGLPAVGMRPTDDLNIKTPRWMAWHNATDGTMATPTAHYGVEFNAAKRIFVATKSGMCVLRLKQTATDWRCKMQVQPATNLMQDHRVQDVFRFGILVNALDETDTNYSPDIKIKNITVLNQINFTQKDVNGPCPVGDAFRIFHNTTNGYAIFDMGIPLIDRTEYLFVAKGDRVYMAMMPLGSGKLRAVTWNATYIKNRTHKMVFEIPDCKVY